MADTCFQAEETRAFFATSPKNKRGRCGKVPPPHTNYMDVTLADFLRHKSQKHVKQLGPPLCGRNRCRAARRLRPRRTRPLRRRILHGSSDARATPDAGYCLQNHLCTHSNLCTAICCQCTQEAHVCAMVTDAIVYSTRTAWLRVCNMLSGHSCSMGG